MDVIKKATEIAKKDLRKNYIKEGILASQGTWQQIWARDSCFASLGALKLKDTQVVRNNLTTLLNLQKKNGLIPFRVGAGNPLKLLIKQGLFKKPKKTSVFKGKAQYRFEKPPWFPNPIDSNSLLIISAYHYAKISKDEVFLKENFEKLKLALSWLNKKTKDGMLWQGHVSDWADCIMRRGHVLYSNVLYYAALMAMDNYSQKAQALKKKINQNFWTGEFFYDAIPNKTTKRFSTDGNLLAIIFGLATQAQGEKIIEYIEKNNVCKVPCICNYPPYKNSFADWSVNLFGFADYQTKTPWLWLGCLYVAAKKILKLNYEKELITLSELIVKNKTVHETLNAKGSPYKSGVYSSEPKFAWAAGLYLFAIK